MLHSSNDYPLTPSPDPPTTQVQCDQGKPPVSGFAIGADNSITYQGSAKFYACPATDTEYNIYINPDFGQTKCFPIQLTASGCGAEQSTCPAASTVTETAWQTAYQTVTETAYQTDYQTNTQTNYQTDTQTGWQTVWQTTTAWQTTIFTVTRPPVTYTSTYTVAPSCPVLSSSSSSTTTSCTTLSTSTTTPPPYSTAMCHKCHQNSTMPGFSNTQTYAKTTSTAYEWK
jgi:hypothetical protein